MDTRLHTKKRNRKTRKRPKVKHVYIGQLEGPRGGKSVDLVIDDDKADARVKLMRRNRTKKVKSVKKGVSSGSLTQRMLDKYPKTKNAAHFFD